MKLKDLKNFNQDFLKNHDMKTKDLEKAKIIFKKEYEREYEKFKNGKLKIKWVRIWKKIKE